VIARALDRVTSPGQHAVLVEMLPVGAGRRLLHEMLAAYASARGEVDGVAWASGGDVFEHAVSKDGLAGLSIDAPEVVVVKLVGLCIRDYLELETGTHIWRSSAREPELLRVRVLPAEHGASPGDQVRAFRAARAAAEHDADGTTARPDALLPIVRTIWFDPPPRGKAGTLLEMEDFVVGLPYATRVTRLSDAFAKLWLYRVSRIEPDGGSA
jgi:ATP-dependent Clp protease ATP-binding subunit ClpA/ATP-dependent Clp protease ATP-binding subunit ClpC